MCKWRDYREREICYYVTWNAFWWFNNIYIYWIKCIFSLLVPVSSQLHYVLVPTFSLFVPNLVPRPRAYGQRYHPLPRILALAKRIAGSGNEIASYLLRSAASSGLGPTINFMTCALTILSSNRSWLEHKIIPPVSTPAGRLQWCVPHQWRPRKTRGGSKDRICLLKTAIVELQQKGAIKEVEELEDHYLSTLFVQQSQNNKLRPVINLKSLNNCVQLVGEVQTGRFGHGTHSSQTRGLSDEARPQRCVFHEPHKKYLRFQFQNIKYEFQYLQFGLYPPRHELSRSCRSQL